MKSTHFNRPKYENTRPHAPTPTRPHTQVVNYDAEDATSAYLMVTNTSNGTSNNYILDVQQSSVSIDVSTYTTGLYNIILVCDGEIQNSKTLLKQ